ncbi:MAG TPA: Zn-ribbon domain-containing OB-fold protein [Acidimicrobiia bacterium]|nr:Zn-ribbon domain-containing OB-fold protein [Acidimicrobiia bacterium]
MSGASDRPDGLSPGSPVGEVVAIAEWTKPLPNPDAVNGAYWQAAADGRLLVQECPTCGHRQWYPRALCTNCAGTPEWLECSGRGTVHTFTVIRQFGMKAFRDELPYVIAMIELEEGPLVFGNVTDCDVDDVAIGMPVEVWFTKAADDIGVASWRPAPA